MVLAAACTGGETAPTATTPQPEAPAISTLPAPTTTSTAAPTTTLLPPAATPPPAEGLLAEIEALIDEAEQIRGLGFLTEPRILLVDSAQFAAAVDLARLAFLTEARDRARTVLFRLAGLLQGAEDLATLRSEVVGRPEFAWYNPQTGSLLVTVGPDGLGPLARSEIVHEVVHAVTDQHYRWWDARMDLVRVAAEDRLAALDALVEGDATYFQVVYVQGLTASERDEIARSFLGSVQPVADPWVVEDFAFPFEAGFDFVADLVAGGGIAAVDRAYLDVPVSTEQILHPGRYRRGEVPADAGVVDVVLDSYTALDPASLGEWNLRLLLGPTVSAGLLSQTADGWGGDNYRLYITGGGEAAVGLLYLGDSDAHTTEVMQAFINLATEVLDLGDGERSGGGDVYSRRGRTWVFINREGPGLLVVMASAPAAGRALAEALDPPVPAA